MESPRIKLESDLTSSLNQSASSCFMDEVLETLKCEGNPQYVRAFSIVDHKHITEDALVSSGLGGTSRFAIELGDLRQDLDKETRANPCHHFDDNSLLASWTYVSYLKRGIFDKIATSAMTNKEQYEVLYDFGQMMHTMQDFYAHSNYVELKLKENPHLKPQDIPLMDWDDLSKNENAVSGGKLRTGYYWYKNIVQNELVEFFLGRAGTIKRLIGQHLEFPGTHFLDNSQYKRMKTFNDRLNMATDEHFSLLHRDLAKDDRDDDEGKVRNPYTGYSFYDYARDLARRETERQWKQVQEQLEARQKNGASGLTRTTMNLPDDGRLKSDERTLKGLIVLGV